jgi:hypothetical protein
MTRKMAVGVTLLNVVLFAVTLSQTRPVSAQGTPGILRGSGLEIVDARGQVRASIAVYPDDGTSPAPGRASYPEDVVLRLHDRNGKPTVKLDTHEAGVGVPKGSGLGLLGDTDDTQAYIGTEGATSKVELKNRDGQRQHIKP